MKPMLFTPALFLVSAVSFAAPPIEKLSNLSDTKQKNIIEIYPRDSTGKQRLIILSPKRDRVLLDSENILTTIPNEYSPSSYDGFKLETTSPHSGSLGLIDNQSEVFEVSEKTDYQFDKIILVTIEDGNTQNNFNIVYSYESEAKDFKLNALYSVQNNNQCDQSVTAVYKIASPSIEETLSNFDGTETFERLKTIRKQLNSNESYGAKILTNQTLSIYENAMKEYKSRNKSKLKEIVSSLIESGGDSETCPPESYIISKYYLPQDLTFSNNLGFLFEQTGHYAEAITLLRKVIQDNPQRTVAYLNLADSYWGAGNHASAKENYLHYVKLMRSADKGGKIPSRILERTQ